MKLKYIGVDDHVTKLFENQYPVPQGITYNSWLLAPEAGHAGLRAVMDTVDSRFADQWLQNLEEALEGASPDLLVCLHLEPDHSGAIDLALQRWPGLKVVATKKAVAMMPHFVAEPQVLEGRTIGVDDSGVIDLGNGETLTLYTAPMVHWPEVAVAWLESQGTLFSADAFGTFGTAPFPADWAAEGARYYCNICGKYGPQVQALLRKAAALPVKRVCPLHGPEIDAAELPALVSLYDQWSRWEPDTQRVMVAYASIYGNTAAAATRLGQMIQQRGYEVEMIDLVATDVSYAVAAAFRCGRWVLAASSYDAGVFPPMHTLLHHLQMKGLRKRRVALMQNGSWAPTAARTMRTMLATMREVELLPGEVTITTRLTEADIPALESLADSITAPTL